MDNKEIKKVILQTKEEDKNLFPDRIWFKIYNVVYPLSVWFACKRIKPNYITLLMLPSAVIAASLFFTGNIICIIAGALVIQLFQIFDYCDGKVARATNQKSKYGKELDFLMHVICHPIVFLSFSGLLKLIGNLDNLTIILIVFTGAVIESMIRSLKNLVDAMDYRNALTTSNIVSAPKKKGLLFIVDSIYNGIISFPCFMCILPFLAIIDYFATPSFSCTFIFIIIQIVYNFVYLLRMIISVQKRCLNG